MIRSIINTLLAGMAGIVMSVVFKIAAEQCDGRRFNDDGVMTVTRSTSVSGVVSIGSVSTLMIQPYGAIIIGMVSSLFASMSQLYLEG